jgi:hypothetical protein
VTARNPEDIHDELAKMFDSLCDPPCGYCGDGHIDKWLDEHPCKHCGGHYDNHDYLTPEEIDYTREQGYTVDICENRVENRDQSSTFFCMVTSPPEDPCDEEFMKEIST